MIEHVVSIGSFLPELRGTGAGYALMPVSDGASDPLAQPFGLGRHRLAQDAMVCGICGLPYNDWLPIIKCPGKVSNVRP